MDQTDFDAAGFVHFDLENGAISCVREQPLALVPLSVLNALAPGDGLRNAASEFGRLHGEAMVASRRKSVRPIGVEALADHLGGTAAALGMGRLSLEIHGDALTFRVQPGREIAASRGYQGWVCGFIAGYLSALADNRFDVLPLPTADGHEWYFAGNPQAVAQVRIWVEKGKDPLKAIHELAGGNA